MKMRIKDLVGMLEQMEDQNEYIDVGEVRDLFDDFGEEIEDEEVYTWSDEEQK